VASRTDDEVKQSFFENLLNLEINTITKQGMTGRKMPAPAIALYEINTLYSQALENTGATGQLTVGAPVAVARVNAETQPVAFARIAQMARDSTSPPPVTPEGEPPPETPTVEPDPATSIIVKRIAGNSDRLAEIIARPEIDGPVRAWARGDRTGAPPDLPLTPEDLVVIRKVWELGVEPVSIQTVIQADGDIITRATPKAASRNADSTRDLHRSMVATSVEQWQFLVKVATDLLGVIVGFFTPSAGRD